MGVNVNTSTRAGRWTNYPAHHTLSTTLTLPLLLPGMCTCVFAPHRRLRSGLFSLYEWCDEVVMRNQGQSKKVVMLLHKHHERAYLTARATTASDEDSCKQLLKCTLWKSDSKCVCQNANRPRSERRQRLSNCSSASEHVSETSACR